MLLFAFILAFTACTKEDTKNVVPPEPIPPILQSRIDEANTVVGSYAGHWKISMLGTATLPSNLTVTHPADADYVNLYISCWNVTAKATRDTTMDMKYRIPNTSVNRVIMGTDTIDGATIYGSVFIGNNQALFNCYVTGYIKRFSSSGTLPMNGTFVR